MLCMDGLQHVGRIASLFGPDISFNNYIPVPKAGLLDIFQSSVKSQCTTSALIYK